MAFKTIAERGGIQAHVESLGYNYAYVVEIVGLSLQVFHRVNKSWIAKQLNIDWHTAGVWAGHVIDAEKLSSHVA